MARFFADAMLGKLARWLRVSGIDVAYEQEIADNELIRRAQQEERIILTRDTRLIQRLDKDTYCFIEHDHVDDQLRQFYAAYPDLLPNLSDDRQLFSRCLECNTALEAVAKETIKDKLWPYVAKTQENFSTCPSCQRIYWQATHVEQMKARLQAILMRD